MPFNFALYVIQMEFLEETHQFFEVGMSRNKWTFQKYVILNYFCSK